MTLSEKHFENCQVRTPKNWCLRTVVLEKTPETSLDSKEIKPVSLKGDQSWIFIGRTDVEAETPIVWPPDAKNWLVWKDPDAGKDWRWEEKGITEDKMVGWHHQLNGYEFEYTPRVGDGQGGLACCSSWGCKELDMTEWLSRLIDWLTDADNSLEKSLMLEKIEDRRRGIRRWDDWMASRMQWTWTWANSRRWWGSGRPGVLHSLGWQRLGSWTTAIHVIHIHIFIYKSWVWSSVNLHQV